MKGDSIPDTHHIARYCGKRLLDESTGTPSYAAFMVRKAGDYVSVNWLESLRCVSRAEEINQLRVVLSRKLKVGAEARIAVLNVGEVCRANEILRVLHEPEPNDPSHSGIHGIPVEDDLVAAMIAEKVLDLYGAR